VSSERYEVVVKGRLGPALVGSIDGFEVIRVVNGHTHLVGWVDDQSQLHKLLTVLRDLNIELVSLAAARGSIRSQLENNSQ